MFGKEQSNDADALRKEKEIDLKKREKKEKKKKKKQGKATTLEPRLLFAGVSWMCLFMNH